MSDVFDIAAVREWEDYDLPADRDKWPALINQIRSDVVVLCDYVEELEAEVAKLRSDLRQDRPAGIRSHSRRGRRHMSKRSVLTCDVCQRELPLRGVRGQVVRKVSRRLHWPGFRPEEKEPDDVCEECWDYMVEAARTAQAALAGDDR